MERAYFLLPDVETTRAVVEDLLLNHVEERYIHVLAREDIPLGDLPQAGTAQRSDVMPAIQKGALLGGAVGVLAGLIVVAVLPVGPMLGAGATVIGLALLAGALGAWMASLVGISAPSSRLRKFRKSIQRGWILLMVDVPGSQLKEIQTLVKRHHPEADVEGKEPTMPPFP